MTIEALGRIIYVGPFDFPVRNAAAQLVVATCQALRYAGHPVSIVARATDEKHVGAEVEVADGMGATLVARSFRPRAPSEAWRTVRKVASLVRAGDTSAIIVYNAPSLTLFLIIMLGRARGVTVVGHCTEWYGVPPLLPSPLRSLMKRTDIALRMRVLHRWAAGMIVSSEYLQSFYKRQLTLVLPTLAPRQAGSVADRPLTHPPVFVYGGTPFELGEETVPASRMKDRLDLAIEWLVLLKQENLEFRLDVFGLTRDQYLLAIPQHRRLLEMAGGVVRFHGRMPHDRVADAVVNADYTLLVRDRTRTTMAGFPTKVTESIMAGTPPIASEVGDTPKYIKHGVTGFLLPVDDEVGALEILRQAIRMESGERMAMTGRIASDRALDPETWGGRLSNFVSRCGTKDVR